jgi:hypothetical protein
MVSSWSSSFCSSSMFMPALDLSVLPDLQTCDHLRDQSLCCFEVSGFDGDNCRLQHPYRLAHHHGYYFTHPE